MREPLTRKYGLGTLRAGCQEKRADSSVGRALPLQGRGHRFNPCSAYHSEIIGAQRQEVCLPRGGSFLHAGIDRRPTILSCRAAVLPETDLRGRRSAWLGRQIVNLEVAGSNPVGPAIFFRVWYNPLCQSMSVVEEGE